MVDEQNIAALDAIYQTIPDYFLRIDRHGRILDLKTGNPEPLIANKDKLIGLSIAEAIKPSNNIWAETIKLVLDTGVMQQFEFDLNTTSKTGFFECRMLRFSADEVIALIRDIEERKKTESDLSRRMELERLERMKFEKFVSEGQERLNGILNSIDDAVWALNMETRQLLYLNPASERVYGRTPIEFYANPNLWFDAAHPDDVKLIENWSQIVEEKGAGEFEFRILRPDDQIKWVRLRLWASQGGTGAIARIDGIVTDITEKKLAEKAIKEAREKEVQIAGNIQKMLLIGQPPKGLIGAEVASLTIPSEGIDGDFYDFIVHRNTCFDVIIGDVMGKGIPAALVGAGTKSEFLRALGSQFALSEGRVIPSPTSLTNMVNADLTQQLISLGKFVTLCFARFHLDEKRIVFIDCGHSKTIHYRNETHDYVLLEQESCPLGFSEEENYLESTSNFGKNDVFFFYSDGITEARDLNDNFFGVERLAEAIIELNQLDPDEIIKGIYKKVVDFSGNAKFDDDFTCVVVKIT